MKDFSNAVNNAMQAMIDSGKVEEIIKTKVEKTVEEAISDALKSYSDFGKDLSKHVKESLKVEVANVNLQEYGQAVLKMVEGLVNKHVQQSAQAQLMEQFTELFKSPPSQLTLQQIIDTYKEGEEDEAHRDGNEYCGLVIEESSYGYIYVGLNPADMKVKYGSYTTSKERVDKVNDCEIQLHFKKPVNGGDLRELAWVSFGGYRQEDSKCFMPTNLSGMARKLYQMYCAGTKIVIDSIHADDYERAYNWVD